MFWWFHYQNTPTSSLNQRKTQIAIILSQWEYLNIPDKHRDSQRLELIGSVLLVSSG